MKTEWAICGTVFALALLLSAPLAEAGTEIYDSGGINIIDWLGGDPVSMLSGDANRDGQVSADDYASVQSHYGDTGEPGIPGDADLDGAVSADDYISVQENFGDTSGLDGDVTVPEPATLALLVIGGVALLRRRSAQVLRRR